MCKLKLKSWPVPNCFLTWSHFYNNCKVISIDYDVWSVGNKRLILVLGLWCRWRSYLVTRVDERGRRPRRGWHAKRARGIIYRIKPAKLRKQVVHNYLWLRGIFPTRETFTTSTNNWLVGGTDPLTIRQWTDWCTL